jgi:glycosyltransferase involved in cell wall biosynthesis
MRIGLLIYGSLETLSGGYLYDRKLVNQLQSYGDQVEVISLPWRNYPLHLMDNFSRSLKHRLREIKADLLLQDELNHPSLFLLNSWLKSQPGTRIISIVHHLRCSERHPHWQNKVYRNVEKRYLQGVDGFIFNSNSTRKVVEGLIGEKKVSVVAFPAGDRLEPDLTADQIRMRSRSEGPLRILFLGNVIPRKGLQLLLEALSGIPTHQWRLSIVGSLEMDTDYVNQTMRKVRQSGLIDRIEILGPLDEIDLIRVMEAGQIMVMPSTYEGFGIAYLEGMGFGLPAIASSSGGADEIISPGVNGFLVPPDNADILRAYLMGVIADRELLVDMSLAALERYQCHPTWEDTTKRIRHFLINFPDQKD